MAGRELDVRRRPTGLQRAVLAGIIGIALGLAMSACMYRDCKDVGRSTLYCVMLLGNR